MSLIFLTHKIQCMVLQQGTLLAFASCERRSYALCHLPSFSCNCQDALATDA